MAETSDVNAAEKNPTPYLDNCSDTSDNSSTKNIYRYFPNEYRTGSSNCSDNDDDDDDDDEGDPYQELFMNAYRSAPASSDEDENEAARYANNNNNNCLLPEAKPLSLMEDWELWDSMDENELKKQLKDHPKLLQEITRKRKRRMQEEDEAANEPNENLDQMMNRFVKYIRCDPTNGTS